MGNLKTAVLLVGHGAPATDCPAAWVGELMGLEWRNHPPGTHPSPDLVARMEELDAKIRNFPRHDGNDPYQKGLKQVANRLKPLLSTELFAIAYNEFCAPSIPQAVENLVEQGAGRILVIPSMLTPGGLHSEIDIPGTLDQMRKKYPAVSIEYLWPFDLTQVAKLLAQQIERFSAAP